MQLYSNLPGGRGNGSSLQYSLDLYDSSEKVDSIRRSLFLLFVCQVYLFTVVGSSERLY